MATHEFHVDYFDMKYLNSQFPNRKNTPHFQLTEGEIGRSSGLGGDPYETPSPDCHVISTPKDFPTLTLHTLQCLKKSESLKNTYQMNFSENASAQIGKKGERVLDKIVALHNDFITPRRR